MRVSCLLSNHSIPAQLFYPLNAESKSLPIDPRIMLAKSWSRRAHLPRSGGKLKRRPRISERPGRRVIDGDEEAPFPILFGANNLLHVAYGENRDMQFLTLAREFIAVLIADPGRHTDLQSIDVLEAPEQGGKEFALCPLRTAH